MGLLEALLGNQDQPSPLGPPSDGQQPQDAPTQSAGKQHGMLKQMLTRFAYGMGQGFTKAAGLPTDDELANSAAQRAQAEAQRQHLQAQTEHMGQMVYVPGVGLVPSAVASKAIPAAITGQSRENAAETAANASRDRAQVEADTKLNATGQQQEGANQRNAATLEANQAIAEKRLDSLREMTKWKLQMSQDIANKRIGAAKDIAGMHINAGFAKEGMKSYDFALDADRRYQQMLDQAANPNPAGDKALLMNHIAMTIGSVKGGRVTESEIQQHLNARDLPSEIMQAWDKVNTGKTLTAEQRKNFVSLGSEVRNSAWDTAYRRADYFGVTATPEDNPVLPKVGTHVPKPGGVQRGASAQPIIQHSPSTGQYRHSLDGGRTWLPGRP